MKMRLPARPQSGVFNLLKFERTPKKKKERPNSNRTTDGKREGERTNGV